MRKTKQKQFKLQVILLVDEMTASLSIKNTGNSRKEAEQPPGRGEDDAGRAEGAVREPEPRKEALIDGTKTGDNAPPH